MYITTAYEPSEELTERTNKLAENYGLKYVCRGSKSISKLQEEYSKEIVVVTDNNIKYYNGSHSIYFHPNVAMLRYKRLLKGESDPLIKLAGIKTGDKVLDCTMGLASDSIIFSLSVGKNGKVVALEKNSLIHMVVSIGVQEFYFKEQKLSEAMQSIEMIHQNYEAFLFEQDDNAFDVVYFDPMFDYGIKEETPLDGLRSIGEQAELTSAIIAEAKRVASKCVIMKNHYQSDKFEALGFTRQVRKTSQFHYGIIDVSEK